MKGFIRPADTSNVRDGNPMVFEKGEAPPPPVFNTKGTEPIEIQRQALPIYGHRQELLYLVETRRVVLVMGETGSGKTTQIPQYLLEAGWTDTGKLIGVTQPRRVAAATVAQRVADEKRVKLGGMVGYSIRFDAKMSPETRIKFLTDGMLLREICIDPLLTQYSVLMIDEAHERTLNTDCLLALLKKILKRRPTLKLIIASATLEIEAFQGFFADFDPAIVSAEGTCYPVDCFYLQEPAVDYLQAALEAIVSIHQHRGPGDILVFVTGQEEVDTLCMLVKDRHALSPNGGTLAPVPLYAGLLHSEQMKAFKPAHFNERKVVVATNIAETSLTIPGIVFVIDSGLSKVRLFDPATAVDRLVTSTISRAEAEQRAGRAGRLCAGQCFRLYTEHCFLNEMGDHRPPEIQRCGLAPLVLQLKGVGVENVVDFDYVTPPPVIAVQHAVELLFSLGAIDAECDLTDPLGTAFAFFPAEPQMAAFLFAAQSMGIQETGEKIAAMLSVQDVWRKGRGAGKRIEETKRKYFVTEGDHISLLNIYNAFEDSQFNNDWATDHGLNPRALRRAVEVKAQLHRAMKKYSEFVDWDPAKMESVRCSDDERQADVDRITLCMVSAWFPNAAHRLSDGSYVTIRSHLRLHLHQSSSLYEAQPDWVLFTECIETDALYMKDCVKLRNPMWLVQVAPHFYDYHRNPNQRKSHKKIASKRHRVYEDDHTKRLRDRARPSNWLDIDEL